MSLCLFSSFSFLPPCLQLQNEYCKPQFKVDGRMGELICLSASAMTEEKKMRRARGSKRMRDRGDREFTFMGSRCVSKPILNTLHEPSYSKLLITGWGRSTAPRMHLSSNPLSPHDQRVLNSKIKDLPMKVR